MKMRILQRVSVKKGKGIVSDITNGGDAAELPMLMQMKAVEAVKTVCPEGGRAMYGAVIRP